MTANAFQPTRRLLLGSAASSLLIRRAIAAEEPIRFGMVIPLTGFSGVYGAPESKLAHAVVDEVNAAGGVKGHQITLSIEDDQSNTDATVRGARKVIDVDKVVALLSVYSSAGAMAVAPLCWESKTFLTTSAGADSITQLPTNGYLIRTQPNTTLQGRKFGEYAASTGAKRVYFVTPQTPFAQSEFDSITGAVKKAGGDAAMLIYDDKKPSYRSEVDEVLRYKADAVIFGGYSPDTTVMLKEFYRASYKGAKVAFGYSVNEKMIGSVPADVVEDVVTISPSPDAGSTAYARMAKLTGTEHPDTYLAQLYDQLNLVILALAASGSGTMDGQAIRDNIRKVIKSDTNSGSPVDNAIDGMKLLAAGKGVSYQGASGPCEFTPIGDIVDCKFRYDQVKGGKLTLLRIT